MWNVIFGRKKPAVQHHGGSKESKVQHLNQHGQSTVDVMKAKEMSRIKAEITKNMFSPIDSDAIQATAGREMQVCAAVKLLQSLGLKFTLMTDGSLPINLFSTAQAVQQPGSSEGF
ncbi:hypothetical protein pdam_00016925 [Pocillopora damicornis]|uniref:Uncharacterized protein n=1 Tax=Pocillopora damicornis TaxID=46731 RepID=A0A3M6UKR0_POCDA|nr:hypothetical protein pdam_00016925 [Pocillopora damicornis]